MGSIGLGWLGDGNGKIHILQNLLTEDVATITYVTACTAFASNNWIVHLHQFFIKEFLHTFGNPATFNKREHNRERLNPNPIIK